MQRTDKVLDTGLASFTKAPGALSRGLRSLGKKVSTTGLHAPESQPERERERERERGKKKKTRGPKLDDARVL